MRKDVTIYDIAKELNLSPTTISRALNDHPSISKNTKLKVTAMANQLGYRFNIFACNLRRQRTNTIGVIVSELNNNFISSVIAGMERVANGSAYSLLISQSFGKVEKEIANVNAMYNSRVDGLLVSLASSKGATDHFDSFIQKDIPVIFFDREAPGHLHCTSIVIDNIQAALKATTHLIEQGCKNMVHVTGFLDRSVYADRLKGFKYTLNDYGLPFPENNLIITNLSEEAGIEAAQQIMDMNPRPDGIFVSNDTCASHLMKALIQAGISIPHDIAVVGFNNDPVSRIVEPVLTTVDYHGTEMGEVAARTLINRLSGVSDMDGTSTIMLRSEVIVRESSLKLLRQTY